MYYSRKFPALERGGEHEKTRPLEQNKSNKTQTFLGGASLTSYMIQLSEFWLHPRASLKFHVTEWPSMISDLLWIPD